MAMDRMTFYEGEKREVLTTVTSVKSKQTTVIARAVFELKNIHDEQVVLTGDCEVMGNEVISFLDLAKKGEYILKVKSYVGREEVVSKAIIVIE